MENKIIAEMFAREKADKLERFRHLNKFVKKGQTLMAARRKSSQ